VGEICPDSNGVIAAGKKGIDITRSGDARPAASVVDLEQHGGQGRGDRDGDPVTGNIGRWWTAVRANFRRLVEPAEAKTSVF
jgi:hypothetical protein